MSNLFKELKRRNVVRVAVAYLVIGWLLLQIGDLLFETLDLDASANRLLLAMIGLGFIPTLLFSWAFEITPEGIKREKDVIRDNSILNETAKKLDYLTLASAISLIIIFGWQQFNPRAVPSPQATNQSEWQQTSQAPINEQPVADSLPTQTVVASSNPNLQSIAVLPFANRSNTADDLFFTDGIHDDLLTQLAKINALNVTSRTSVMQYRDTVKTLPVIGKELGVATILEGGVQRAGNRIRINAQLIQANSDKHLWSETYDREMTIENLFEIQSEITHEIVQAVKVNLTVEEEQAINKIPTKSLPAYEAFLRARSIVNKSIYSKEIYEQAEVWIAKAIELDPNFALAHLNMAGIHGQYRWFGDNSIERRQAAQKSIATAASIGPNSPELLMARSDFLYRFDLNYPAALALLEQAKLKIPSDQELLNLIGFTKRRLGDWKGSEEIAYAIIKNDPLALNTAGNLVETLEMQRKWQQAKQLCDMLIMHHPQNAGMAFWRGRIMLLANGDPKDAIRSFQNFGNYKERNYRRLLTQLHSYQRNYEEVINYLQGSESAAGRYSRAKLTIGQMLLLQGEQQEAERNWQEIIASVESPEKVNDPLRAFELMDIVLAHAYLGHKEQAMKLGQQAINLLPESRDHFFGARIANSHALLLALVGEREIALEAIKKRLEVTGGFIKWDLYLDPVWDFMRDDPRFNKLIRPDNLAQSPMARKEDL